MNGAEIKQMPRIEKLRLMEELWHDLSLAPDSLEMPHWHLEELNETASRLSEGKEEMLDWQDAKKQLRDQFK
jgi:hypothetical protein